METKSERRERKRDKERERMDQGKKAKLLHELIMKRAQQAQREFEERQAKEAK